MSVHNFIAHVKETKYRFSIFFTTEVYRLVVPSVFQAHDDPFARFPIYEFVDNSTERLDVFNELHKALNEMV